MDYRVASGIGNLSAASLTGCLERQYPCGLTRKKGRRDIAGVLLKKEQNTKREEKCIQLRSQAFVFCLALPPNSRSPAGRKAGATVQNGAEQSAAIGRLEAALAKDPEAAANQ